MSFASKMGRCALAVLLSAFVCLSPQALFAFADEDEVTNETVNDAQLTDDNASEIQDSDSTNVDQEEADTSDAETDVDDSTSEVGAEDTNNASADNQNAEPVDSTDEAVEAEADESVVETNEAADAETVSIETSNAKDREVSLAAVENDSASDSTDAESGDAHTFNIGDMQNLMDVFKYDINTQSNQNFTINLTNDIVLDKPVIKPHTDSWYDTRGNRNVVGQNRLCVKNGNTVTILGHGHSLIYSTKSDSQLNIGTLNGNLILGKADGSDSLTITMSGVESTVIPLVLVSGGTLDMYDGVSLTNNVNRTGLGGGAIYIGQGGVANMHGGLISNTTTLNMSWGGGVNIESGTFNMSGGTIKGCSNSTKGDYLGVGGAVALGAHKYAATFTMSGNAVIESSSAPYGGGVYVGQNCSFIMKDNAKLINNTSSDFGGAVYVDEGAAFTMSPNNLITGNSAKYGGGVYNNKGTASITNVYDNSASSMGDDIYNSGTITIPNVGSDWKITEAVEESESGAQAETQAFNLFAVPQAYADTVTAKKAVDNWYYDGRRDTGTTDENGNAVIERMRWNPKADTDDNPQYLQVYTPTGETTNEVMALKAAHGATDETTDPEPAVDTINVFWENYDGTVLFELEKVDSEHVPPADEYNDLSGKEDPTEASDGKYDYDFEGWTRTVEPNGDIVYTAQYEATPQADDGDTPTDTDVPDEPNADVTTPDQETDNGDDVDEEEIKETEVITETEEEPETQTDSANTNNDTQNSPANRTGSLLQTGDDGILDALALSSIVLLAIGSLVVARTRSSKE